MMSEKKKQGALLQCRDCTSSGKEDPGMLVFASPDGVFVHCKKCMVFIVKAEPLNLDLSCDLCKAGIDHEHKDFALPQESRR